MSNRASTNYSEYTDTANLLTEWTNHYDTSNVTVTLETDAGSPGGKVLQIAKSGAGLPLLGFDNSDGANQHALCMFEADNANALVGLWINASGSSGSEEGYYIEADLNANLLTLFEYNAGTPTSKGTASLTMNTGTKYWLRIARFSNGDLRARGWADGTQEPTTWINGGNDATHTTGWAGVSDEHTSGNTVIHYFSCGFGTDYTAACAVLHDDFPSEGIYVSCESDDSVRIATPDGSTFFLVGINHGDAPNDIAHHPADRTIYVALQSLGQLWRYDRYYLNKTVIDADVPNCFSVTVDAGNDLIYYTERRDNVGELHKNAKGGGSRTTLSTSIDWASFVRFCPDDGLIYVGSLNNAKSYNSSGTIQVTYIALTNNISIIADVTNGYVYQGRFSGGTLFRQNLAGGSSTSIDTVNIWGLDFNPTRDEMWGASFTNDAIYHWSALPPVTANRTTIISNFDQVVGLGYFKFVDDLPVINSATPDEGPEGKTVILSGQFFTNASAVKFNGTSASFNVDNDGQITTTVPTGATTGTISVTTPAGTGTSSFTFTVLNTLPPDGWRIELFQIQENVGQTDIEMVGSTFREYYTEGLVGAMDFIPISISNAEESLEWDEGVYRLGSIDVTVQLLEDTYFNSYTDYVNDPIVMVIKDANGNLVFHGPVDPETVKYNAANRATAFRVLSWEVLLEGINTPCRSIYETQFSRDYNGADPNMLNSTFYVKKTLNGVDLSTVATIGSVLVFDTPAGEHRAIVLSNFTDGDDLGIVTISKIEIYLAQNKAIAAGSHSVTQVGSGGLSFRRLKMEFQDASLYELLEQAEDSENGGGMLLQVDVQGKSYTMNLRKQFIDTSGAWYFLDEDRTTIRIYFNICSGTCNPATLETDFLNFGSTISITSDMAIDSGDNVRILGADMYGYDGSTEIPFGAINHYRLNGGVYQGLFSLPELGVLPYIVNTFVFPSVFNARLDRWAELPPNLLEALRQLQNTFGTFTRLTPTIGGTLPRVTVTVKDRKEANTTDSEVVSNITKILEWTENAADLTPTAVVVEPHITYFKPKNSIETVGFYYEGVDVADPAVTGKPKNGRVVTVKVNTAPAYSGDVFFGDGTGVRNDEKLKALAKKFYEYYKAVRRPCELKIEGTPTEDLLGKMVVVSVQDDPILNTTFDRTFFVTGVIVDTNSNQTTIRGRIGEFSGIAGQSPVAIISGQLVWSDVDASGDEDVVLSGLNSYDPQGQDLTYSWKRDTVPVSTSAVYEETLAPGEYDIDLTVTDEDLNTDTVSVVLKVQDLSETLPPGTIIQARFITATWAFNADGDLLVTIEGDEYTKTTNGIKIRTADTQVGLDAAGDTSYNNPQVNLEIVTALASGATKWVRVTLVNDVDGTDSSFVWEFAVTNTAAAGTVGTFYVEVRTITNGAQSIQAGDMVLLCDCTSGDVDLTLDNAGTGDSTVVSSGDTLYRQLVIKKIDSSSNKVNIDVSGGGTIDGQTVVEIVTQYNSITVQSDGSNWLII